MKIFVVGSRGQLGADCLEVFRDAHEVGGMDLPELDITSSSAVSETLRRIRPDFVVNCAAFTDVDGCEADRDTAGEVNAGGPRHLAEYVERHGGTLIHISTDYVFDGERTPPEPYVEDDEPRPVSWYGLTKLEGEKAVRNATTRHIIVRTAWLYGINGGNFLKTMLRHALTNPHTSLRVVDDQYGSPTWSYRLALQIARLIEAGATGTYHATSEGACTWFQLAERFLNAMDIPCEVVPCSTSEYPLPARRPRNSILENRRLKQENLNVMEAWDRDLDRFVVLFRKRGISQYPDEIV